jgi:hypothetical protein
MKQARQDRKMNGMSLAMVTDSDRVQAADRTNSRDWIGSLQLTAASMSALRAAGNDDGPPHGESPRGKWVDQRANRVNP